MTRILGLGHHVPQQIVSNEMLTAYMDTSDEWIKQRSGIAMRRWSRVGDQTTKGESNFELALGASKKALTMASLNSDDIDGVVYASISPDNDSPGSGALLLRELFSGRGVPLFEVRNHCAGFIYALYIARAYIESGTWRNVLVLGGELQSTGLDLSDAGRGTAVLFGDGFGAVILGAMQVSSSSDIKSPAGILSVILESDGAHADRLGVKCPSFARPVPVCAEDFSPEDGGAYPHMDGKFVFKMASTKMPEVVRKVVAKGGFQLEDLKLVVPHQANQRILDMLGNELGIADRVYSNIASYGNTTAGSIPIALSEAYHEGLISSGDLIALVSFGAGFSWGAALIRW